MSQNKIAEEITVTKMKIQALALKTMPKELRKIILTPDPKTDKLIAEIAIG